MGPRFFKRGETGGAHPTRGRHCRFNGATLFQAWRAVSRDHPAQAVIKLQWGHAFSSVESSPSPAGGRRHDYASMGPRFFKRGELVRSVITALTVNASMGPRFFKRGECSPGR